jgi:hypothetical protein
MYAKPESVDAYIAGERPAWQTKVLKRLRELVHKTEPDITEAIKWSAPYFMYQDSPIAWMFCAREWVHFSFLEGAILDDSHGLFVETDNKRARTIKIREGDEFPDKVIAKLIKETVANARAGKKVELDRPKPGSQEFDLPHEYEVWLKEAGRLNDYSGRPYYQQKGWVEWIEQAKTDNTKQKRMDMVLIELKHDQYMPNAADRHKQ